MTVQDLMPPTAGLEESLDPHLETQLRFDRLARHLGLEDWIVEQLRHNQRETTCTLPLLREDGRLESSLATSVQHSHTAGPALASFSFAPSGYLNELRASAFANTCALALYEIPNAGAAANVVADLDQMTEREIRRLVRALATRSDDVFGTRLCGLVPVRDLNQTVVSWLASELADAHSQIAVAGNAADISLDALHAAGIVELLRNALGSSNRKLSGANIAIQGFGPAARAIAAELARHDANVIALADRSGGLLNPDGLDLTSVEHHLRHNDVLFGYSEAEAICNADVLECECDALILAAAPWQITSRNVDRVRAHVLIEVKQHSITETACQAFEGSDCVIVPFVLCEGTRFHAASVQLRVAGMVRRSALEAVVRRAVRRAMRDVVNAGKRWETPLSATANLLGVQRSAAILRTHPPAF